jgi:hypothetical protein
MKYILIFLITTVVYAQPDVNVLSETEFESIQLNGHNISQIRNTNGQESQIVNLFGQALEFNSYSSGRSKQYIYDDFNLNFSSYISESNTNELSGFELTKSTTEIIINNVNFSIGDDISVLSPLNLTPNNGGNYPPGIRSYIIAPCEKCNHYIYVEYSIISNKIGKVGYVEMT